jgi:hypothetical protein
MKSNKEYAAKREKVEKYLSLGYGNNLFAFGIDSPFGNAILNENTTFEEFNAEHQKATNDYGYTHSTAENKIFWNIILKTRENLKIIFLIVDHGMTPFKAKMQLGIL